MLSDISKEIVAAVKQCFDYDLGLDKAVLSATKKEFEGEYTFVVFPLVKDLRQAPEKIAELLGTQLVTDSHLVKSFNVVKGFLNLEMSDGFWLSAFRTVSDGAFGQAPPNGQKIVVEYSSPNTNKPLHLGHIRNILLGWSIAKIAENRGYDVVKTQIINDRGIAVCKSMLAWQMHGDGLTPNDAEKKGDHYVGDFYVKYDQILKAEYDAWQKSEGQNVYVENRKEGESEEAFYKRFKNQYFNQYSQLGQETKAMLIEWENGDEATRALWEKMNNWVYEGFEETYKKLGVDFDMNYYESDTYLLGKEAVEKGMKEGVFYQQEDGSVWVDLEDVGMDKKIVLRSDGTSVYMTQDVGTAQKRYEDHTMDSMVYVVADEQDYHFKVLFEILKRLGEPYADKLHHLSYGMVDLPTGKMKSREGTVVDADDLITEVIEEAKNSSEERGAADHLSDEDKNTIYRKIGLAALKYFIIKINPKKRMIFDPKESVDMQGTTGPYIQNAYVRIRSILRKAEKSNVQSADYTASFQPNPQEKQLMSLMLSFPEVMEDAMQSYDPSVVANYAYTLAKTFHRYYHDNVIFDDNNMALTSMRLELASTVSEILNKAMAVLGIEMPEYM